MANQQGFSAAEGAAALGKLFKHFDRTKMKDKDGNVYYQTYDWLTVRGSKHSTNKSDIDPERTHLNYNMAADDQKLPQMEFFKKRLGEVWCHKSALKNALLDWVVTLPDMEQYAGREREFFEAVYEKLCEMYGRENVVSAWVHMDEGQPHMHFAFLPIVADPKHEQGFKLSRKAVNTCERYDEKRREVKVDTRGFSKKFHDDLEMAIRESMGLEQAGVVLTEEQRAKRQIKENMNDPQELREAKKAVSRLEAERDRLNRSVSRLESYIESLEKIISGLEERVERKAAWVMEIAKTLNLRPIIGKWQSALEKLASSNNPIAKAAVEAAGRISGTWDERQAKRADRAINGELVRIGKEMDADAAEAKRLKSIAAQTVKDARGQGRRGGTQEKQRKNER